MSKLKRFNMKNFDKVNGIRVDKICCGVFFF